MAELLHAKNNWWGDVSGPYDEQDNPDGKGNGILGKIIYRPWLKYDIEPGKVLNENTGVWYNTLQMAIDNASLNDVLRAGDGLFEENVVVNRSVTIIGNGSEKSFILGSVPDKSSSDELQIAPAVTITADDVVLKDLSVFGIGIIIQSDPNRLFWGVGVALIGNDSTIYNVSFNDVVVGVLAGTAGPNPYNGSLNETGGGRNLTVDSCLFQNIYEDPYTHAFFEKTGVTLLGMEESTLRGNVFSDCHLKIMGSPETLHHRIESNSIDGKPLIYEWQWNGSNDIPADAAQVIIVNSSSFVLDRCSPEFGIELISCSYVRIEGIELENFSKSLSIVQCENITISGISITARGFWHILQISNSRSIVITNSTFDGQGRYFGVVLLDSELCKITDSTFTNWSQTALGIQTDSSSNIVQNTSFQECDIAIELRGNATANHIVDSVISASDGHTGIKVSENSNNNSIERNIISGFCYHGIRIEMNSSGTLIDSTNISDCYRGIFCDEIDGVAIQTSEFYANEIGIFVRSSNNISVRNARFSQSTDYGIYVQGIVHMDVEADRNFWGDASGPYHSSDNPDGKGDEVSDNVDFTPWFSNDLSIRNVDKNLVYAFLQEAIDEADPYDTIEIDAGIYFGSIVIDKPLYVQGAGSNVVNLTDVMSESSGIIKSVVSLEANNIALTGLTINGISNRSVGIDIQMEGCTVSDVKIRNTQIGIRVRGNKTLLENCTVEEDMFRDWGVVCPADIWIDGSWNNSIVNSSLSSDGIIFDSDPWNLAVNDTELIRSQSFENCTVGGLPVYIGIDLNGELIDDNQGQILLVNCTNIEVDGISLGGTGIPILLIECDSITLSNCSIGGAVIGVHAVNGDRIIIQNLTMENGRFCGISFRSMTDCVLYRNTISSFERGIYIDNVSNTFLNENFIHFVDVYGIGSYGTSKGTSFIGNVLTHGKRGIVIEGNGSIEIKGGSISDFEEVAILCTDSIGTSIENVMITNTDGIFIADSINISLIGCILEDGGKGIVVKWSKGVNIENISIQRTLIGIYLFHAENVSISRCEIRENDIGVDIQNGSILLVIEANLRNNQEGMRISGAFGVDIHLSNIVANNEYGLHENQSTVDAAKNYWGHYYGPLHEHANPGGGGDQVVGENVTITPYLKGPFDNLIPEASIVSINPDPAFEDDYINFVGTAIDDGTILRYVWSTEGIGELYNGTASSFYFSSLPYGTHVITLRVMDRYYIWSEPARRELVVYDYPEALIVNITKGPFEPGEEIQFEGAAEGEKTGEEDGVLYQWRSSISGIFYNGTSPIIIETNLSSGWHMISLMVRNGNGIWSSWDHYWNVIISDRPVAFIDSITPDYLVDEPVGINVSFNGSAIDDGNIRAYVWRSDVQGELHNGTEPNFIRNDIVFGIHTITFHVLDWDGMWSEPVHYNSLIVNQRPTAKVLGVSPTTALPGESVRFIGTGTDDGDIPVYEWASSIDGILSNSSEQDVRIGGLSPGSHTITLRVQDALGFWSDPVSELLVVLGCPGSEIVSILPETAWEGESITFVAGSEVDIELYRWTSDLQGVLSNGSEASTNLKNLKVGNHIISLQVKRTSGCWSDPITRELTILVNQQPEIRITTHSDGQKVKGKNKIRITGTASDDHGVERVEYRAEGGEWIIADGTESWSILWEPKHNGAYPLIFRSYDGARYSDVTTITLIFEESDDSEGLRGALYLTLAASCVIALIAGLVLMNRKSPKIKNREEVKEKEPQAK